MVSSILTNNGAMTALQSLKSTQKNLLDTQNRISTGLKVGTAKDNAATWAVATSMRGDIANFKQVSENLSVSSGVVKTAATGTEQIATLISKIREQVTSVQDGVKDAKTVQAAIDEYVGQIKNIVDSSAFKGVNLINNTRGGDEKILASVNADGGVQNPTYITVASQNLTMEGNGALSGLATLKLEDRVSQYSYAQPTGDVDVGDKLSFTFKVGTVTKKAEFEATSTSLSDLMAGMRDAINAAAGEGNAIAKVDAQGKLVVDASLASDSISFDGATALAKTVDIDGNLTLGAGTDLNPPKPKYSYEPVLNDSLQVGGGETFEFSFKVGGVAKVATYVTNPGDDFDAVFSKLKDQINLQAGAGNEFASIDEATGKLVVDAAKASDTVEFDGVHALKRSLDDAGPALAAASGAKYEYNVTALDADANFADPSDALTFAFTLNGQSVIARGEVGAAGTAEDALAALVADINTKAGATIAYLENDTKKMVVDASAAKGLVSFTGGTALQLSDVGATAGATVTSTNLATTAPSYVYTAPDETTRITKLSFSFTDASGANQTATVDAADHVGKSNKELVTLLAGEINTKAGATIAFIDVNGNLVLDKGRDTAAASPVVDFDVNASGALTVSATQDYGDETALSPTSSLDYSDLLATLKSVETAVLAAGAAFGAAQTRIDLQKDFMDKLVDTLTSGVGALVDADMSEEAARLQALQVQEQLGTQALSIANQAPQSILSLFRG
ncbi:MAG TPA: flagellin [Roseomonas sp.]|nr:flagellin [Roseomonas sp.]